MSEVMPLKKRILKAPALEEILQLTGGYGKVASRTRAAEIETELRNFESKADYANLTIVQRALIILDAPAKRVILTTRADADQYGARITSGASILTSSSPEMMLQDILNKKFKHSGIRIFDHANEMIGVNDVKGGYVFLIGAIRVDLNMILKSKSEDKAFKRVSIEEAIEALEAEKRQLEINALQHAID